MPEGDAWAAFDGAATAADDDASPGVASGSLETSSFEHVSAPGDTPPDDTPAPFAAFQEPAADGDAESPGTTEPAVDDDAPAAGDSMSGDASRPPPPTAIVCKPCAPAATEADYGFTAFEAAPTDTPARADAAPTPARRSTSRV